MPSRRFPGWSDDTSSPELLLPYDTVPGQWLRVSTTDCSAATVPRAGFGYPLRGSTTGPPDAYASERPWASPFKVFPSSQAVPLSGSIPSCRYPLPRGVAGHKAQTTPLGNAAGFRALFLRRIRSVTGITNDSSRRYLLGFRPSRACSHSTWRSLWSRRLPSRPWAA